jgi:hypothetical protein
MLVGKRIGPSAPSATKVYLPRLRKDLLDGTPGQLDGRRASAACRGRSYDNP